jgi:Pyruvate/2-oxoacid:ferredoxin oxidoreductase gamma subunit
LKVIGRPITNTAMLGSIVKATGMVQLDSLLEVVKERFSGRIQETNIEVVKTAYKEVVKG